MAQELDKGAVQKADSNSKRLDKGAVEVHTAAAAATVKHLTLLGIG